MGKWGRYLIGAQSNSSNCSRIDGLQYIFISDHQWTWSEDHCQVTVCRAVICSWCVKLIIPKSVEKNKVGSGMLSINMGCFFRFHWKPLHVLHVGAKGAQPSIDWLSIDWWVNYRKIGYFQGFLPPNQYLSRLTTTTIPSPAPLRIVMAKITRYNLGTTQVVYIIQPYLDSSNSPVVHGCGDRGFFAFDMVPHSMETRTRPAWISERESILLLLSPLPSKTRYPRLKRSHCS